ncbi:MAG: NUDIX domain-containing protein [Acidobacteriota bacterium]
MTPSPRLAVRAVIVVDGRLLLVNAWPGRKSDLWCAPGGGVVPGTSLPDNLQREVHEETGLSVRVDALCLVNEFHDPASGFHQVELFFRCQSATTEIPEGWEDPEKVVNRWRWVLPSETGDLNIKPDALAKIAWSAGAARYDPLECIQR